jgi:hypothetical protein
MKCDWYIEVTNVRASQKVFDYFHDRNVNVEFVNQEQLRSLERFVDFDFELRCMCLGNYWDPPVFIYGHIISSTRTQLCAVIIKNNRRNLHCTFILEVVSSEGSEIHSRVCEVLLLLITDFKDLPKRNVVIKCTENCAFIVGAINNLDTPVLTPSQLACRENFFLYVDQMFSLCRMCFQFIAVPDVDRIHREYKENLLEDLSPHNFQTITGVKSDGNLLGCISPIYRSGKALKFRLNSRQMIFAMCDSVYYSNVDWHGSCEIKNVKYFTSKSSFRFKTERFQLIPLDNVQRGFVLPIVRPYMEFVFVDAYRRHLNLLNIFNQRGLEAQTSKE